MTSDKAEKIISFTEGYNKHFEELCTFLTTKQSKVIEDDLLWLLDSLVEEQKMVMRGSSLETKRLAMMLDLGYENVKMNELLADCPEELKGRMALEFTSMEHYVKRIKQLNSDIIDMVERKLSFQSEILTKAGVASSDTYNVSGEKISKRSGGGIIGSV